jgi:hypothetical protein
MDTESLIARLEKNGDTVASLVRGLSGSQVCWKPDPESWSILDVMAHLLDEEREDFRARIDATIHRPSEPWVPIDPPGWVKVRDYASRDLEETLSDFLEERKESVAWLRGLGSVDWDTEYEHPLLGTLRVGDLLTSWLAHDLLHIRQLTGLHWQHYSQLMEPYKTAYAGDW